MAEKVLFRNKKGSLGIFIFIMLTLALSVFSIFSFLTNPPKVNAAITDIDSLDRVYEEEVLAEFYLKDAFENAFVRTYQEFFKNGDYLLNLKIPQTKELQGLYYFGSISQDFKEDFAEEVSESFKQDFVNRDFDKAYLKELQNHIDKDNFRIFYNDLESFIELVVEDFSFYFKQEDIEINYTPVIKERIDIQRFGLESFREIVGFTSVCSDRNDFDEQKQCYELYKDEIDGFDVQVREVVINKGDDSEKKELVLDFRSKKEFLIENDFRKIEFSFIVG